jgi:hypothetical protein
LRSTLIDVILTPRIVRGTADDEHYQCNEPEIIKCARTLIINKWPESSVNRRL